MHFLSQNPKTRKITLIVIASGLALFGFAFLYISYFAPGNDVSGQASVGANLKALSEQAVKRIERDISSIENELQNDFYKSLRKHTWTPDTTAPGNKKPFNK